MKKKWVTFDPRSKLATVLFASFLLVSRSNNMMEFIFMFSISVLLILNGSAKKGIVVLFIYLGLSVIITSYFGEITGGISALLSFLFVASKMLLPPVAAGMFATSKVSVGEWVAAMKKWHIPNTFIIPFVVVCRFFPTIIQEFRDIRQAMKFRGIDLSLPSMLRHPVQTMEYLFVPLLMTVDKAAIDLSAAALVRGLGNKGKHTSIYRIKFRVQDYLLIGYLLVLLLVKGTTF